MCDVEYIFIVKLEMYLIASAVNISLMEQEMG